MDDREKLEYSFEDIHSAFWFGVDAARQGRNMIDAFAEMMDRLEEEKKKWS